MSIPPSVSMLLFCYLVLQQGFSSPQAPYKRSLSFKHTQRLAYFPLSPGRLTTCQRHAGGEQALRLTPLLSWPTSTQALWLFCAATNPCKTFILWKLHLKQSSFLGSVWLGEHPPTPPSLPPLFLPSSMKLSPFTPRQSDPIWSVWRGPFSITSLIKSPPVKRAQGWAGTDLGRRGSGACSERICSEPRRRLNGG